MKYPYVEKVIQTQSNVIKSIKYADINSFRLHWIHQRNNIYFLSKSEYHYIILTSIT